MKEELIHWHYLKDVELVFIAFEEPTNDRLEIYSLDEQDKCSDLLQIVYPDSKNTIFSVNNLRRNLKLCIANKNCIISKKYFVANGHNFDNVANLESDNIEIEIFISKWDDIVPEDKAGILNIYDRNELDLESYSYEYSSESWNQVIVSRKIKNKQFPGNIHWIEPAPGQKEVYALYEINEYELSVTILYEGTRAPVNSIWVERKRFKATEESPSSVNFNKGKGKNIYIGSSSFMVIPQDKVHVSSTPDIRIVNKIKEKNREYDIDEDGIIFIKSGKIKGKNKENGFANSKRYVENIFLKQPGLRNLISNTDFGSLLEKNEDVRNTTLQIPQIVVYDFVNIIKTMDIFVVSEVLKTEKNTEAIFKEYIKSPQSFLWIKHDKDINRVLKKHKLPSFNNKPLVLETVIPHLSEDKEDLYKWIIEQDKSEVTFWKRCLEKGIRIEDLVNIRKKRCIKTSVKNIEHVISSLEFLEFFENNNMDVIKNRFRNLEIVNEELNNIQNEFNELMSIGTDSKRIIAVEKRIKSFIDKNIVREIERIRKAENSIASIYPEISELIDELKNDRKKGLCKLERAEKEIGEMNEEIYGLNENIPVNAELLKIEHLLNIKLHNFRKKIKNDMSRIYSWLDMLGREKKPVFEILKSEKGIEDERVVYFVDKTLSSFKHFLSEISNKNLIEEMDIEKEKILVEQKIQNIILHINGVMEESNIIKEEVKGDIENLTNILKFIAEKKEELIILGMNDQIKKRILSGLNGVKKNLEKVTKEGTEDIGILLDEIESSMESDKNVIYHNIYITYCYMNKLIECDLEKQDEWKKEIIMILDKLNITIPHDKPVDHIADAINKKKNYISKKVNENYAKLDDELNKLLLDDKVIQKIEFSNKIIIAMNDDLKIEMNELTEIAKNVDDFELSGIDKTKSSDTIVRKEEYVYIKNIDYVYDLINEISSKTKEYQNLLEKESNISIERILNQIKQFDREFVKQINEDLNTLKSERRYVEILTLESCIPHIALFKKGDELFSIGNPNIRYLLWLSNREPFNKMREVESARRNMLEYIKDSKKRNWLVTGLEYIKNFIEDNSKETNMINCYEELEKIFIDRVFSLRKDIEKNNLPEKLFPPSVEENPIFAFDWLVDCFHSMGLVSFGDDGPKLPSRKNELKGIKQHQDLIKKLLKDNKLLPGEFDD